MVAGVCFLFRGIASTMKGFGIEKCVLMAWMASRARHDTGATDPFDDEVTIAQLLTKNGFGAQQRIRMFIDPHDPSWSSDKCDWWMDGRLCYLYPGDGEAAGRTDGTGLANFFRRGSELARTTRVLVVPKQPKTQDLVKVTDADDLTELKVDAIERAAQHGVEAHKAALTSLLTKSTAATGAPVNWFRDTDVVTVLDLSPYSGEAAVATAELQVEMPFGLRHAIVNYPHTLNYKAGWFTKERVAAFLAQQWFDKKRQLYRIFLRGDGSWEVTPESPSPNSTCVDPESLKSIPGAYEAYLGLHRLDLQVMGLRGTKMLLKAEIHRCCPCCP